MEALGGEDIPRECADLRLQIRKKGLQPDLVARSFALVREVSARATGMRHFDVQLLGGWILLNGMVAEMDTGEGKTLTATLPACTLALSGVPVHLITVNDYLAKRDAELMGPIYRALGLSVGVVTQGMDLPSRQAAYACDVTYCTNKEVAFDYLKDRIVLGGRPNRAQLQVEKLAGKSSRMRRLILRGLFFGIVDEADSVLIDEARTPLIISEKENNELEKRVYASALSLSERFEVGRDFRVDVKEREVRLTPAGLKRIEMVVQPMGAIWSGKRQREEIIRQALTARHLFQRDEHYLVKDQKVQIIDEFTGRVMRDRSWERGLQQLIEIKEGCPITARQVPVTRISYQKFFRCYLRLSGMTGTAREVRGELWSVYSLPTVSVPLNRPSRRTAYSDKVFSTLDEKWEGVVKRIRTFYGLGRPVLVGTRSLSASEHLSKLLDEESFPHLVLNARQDVEEAEVIAKAGEKGRITVATNMAGRGTDIKLGDGVSDLGGLHVISTERHEADRIDRQLSGRCGRQGDAGSYESFISLEDDIASAYSSDFWKWVARRSSSLPRWPKDIVGAIIIRRAQRAAERQNSRIRRGLLKMDEYLETQLAFSGRPE